MEVLYIGNKKVVEEILRSVAKDMECEFNSASLDNISGSDSIVFIDYEIFKDSNDIDINTPIIIASSSDDIGDIDSEVLCTPFLPNDVYEILEDRCPKESIDNIEATILDSKEIEIVKSFLADVESDIEDSDILADENQEIDDLKERDSIVMTPDELIAIIDRLKTKRLRKLLRGATIELKITFPKDI